MPLYWIGQVVVGHRVLGRNEVGDSEGPRGPNGNDAFYGPRFPEEDGFREEVRIDRRGEGVFVEQGQEGMGRVAVVADQVVDAHLQEFSGVSIDKSIFYYLDDRSSWKYFYQGIN